MRRWGGPVRVVLVSLFVIAALFVFVFPSQALLTQRSEISDARENLATLQEQNERLAAEAARLADPAAIERLARERFNLVRPGERAFAVIPGPAAEPELPEVGDG